MFIILFIIIYGFLRGRYQNARVEFHAAAKCKPKSETFICFRATRSFHIYIIFIHNIHLTNEYSTRGFYFLSRRRSQPQLVEGLTRAREYMRVYYVYKESLNGFSVSSHVHIIYIYTYKLYVCIYILCICKYVCAAVWGFLFSFRKRILREKNTPTHVPKKCERFI